MVGDSLGPLEPPEAVGELVEEFPDHAPFVDKIRDGFHPADLLALSVVPAVLLAVFALPMESRRELAFDYGDPTPLTAFAANYVHLTPSHLLSNLGGYLVLGSLTYLLALSTDSRRRFYLAVTTILVVFPVPLTYLNLAVPRSGILIGFSGLLMAILGYELVELSRYLGTYFTDDFGVENAPAFFFLVTAFVGAPHAGTTLGFVVVVASLPLAVLYSLAFLLSYRPTVAGFRAAFDRQGYFELSVLAVVFVFIFVWVSFPQNPVVEAGIVNVYVHLLGFCGGFISAYAWILLTTPAVPEEAVPRRT